MARGQSVHCLVGGAGGSQRGVTPVTVAAAVLATAAVKVEGRLAAVMAVITVVGLYSQVYACTFNNFL